MRDSVFPLLPASGTAPIAQTYHLMTLFRLLCGRTSSDDGDEEAHRRRLHEVVYDAFFDPSARRLAAGGNDAGVVTYVNCTAAKDFLDIETNLLPCDEVSSHRRLAAAAEQMSGLCYDDHHHRVLGESPMEWLQLDQMDRGRMLAGEQRLAKGLRTSLSSFYSSCS